MGGWGGWAAAVAAVIIAVSIYMAPNEDPAQMALRYSEDIYPILAKRGGEEVSTAYERYRDGEFANARNAFEDAGSEEVMDRFYSALSAFYSEDYEDALIEFRTLSTGDHGFADQSKWFLAVSALQINNCQEAKAALNYLSGKDGYRHQESENLLLVLVHHDCEEQADQ